MKKLLLLAAVAVSLNGCTKPDYSLNNTASSPITKKGTLVGTMNFTFIYYGDTHQNLLNATSTSGETFSGNLIQQGTQVPDIGKSLVALFFPSTPTTLTSYNSFWHVQILGSKGTSLTCDFNSYDVNKKPVQGGEGGCTGSDGSAIPLSIVNEPTQAMIEPRLY